MSVSSASSMIPPAPASVVHRFVPGMRFEDVLVYQTCAHTGPAGWEPLPLDPETCEDFADDGAWWCVRRCAAVLHRRPWKDLQLQPHLPVHLSAQRPLAPDVSDVARTLWSLMPGWDVVCCDAQTGLDPVTACAPALLAGGSALLLLQSQEVDDRSLRRFWAWVVGLELPGGAAWAPGRSASAGGPQAQVRALLTIPFGWPMPSSCGYAARVQRNKEGLCDVGGISGRWHMSRCQAVITLAEPFSG